MLKSAFRYRRYIFLVLAAQYLFVFFHRVSPAVVATDLMHTFRVGSGALGVLASAYFYPYAFMQIPAGILADRWGTRKTVTLFGSLAGIGAICFALSPNFGVAVLSRALVGFGLSAIFVPSMTLFCAWFSEKEYGIVSGIFIAMGGIGWLTAATPLALLVLKLGWVGAFILIGAITLVLTGITWLIVSDRPEDMGFPSMTEKEGERLSIGPVRAGCARVLSQRRFWPLAIYNLLTGVSLFGFCGLWAGPYLTDVYRLPGPRAANVLTIIAAALIFGGPFLTSLSEKVFHSQKEGARRLLDRPPFLLARPVDASGDPHLPSPLCDFFCHRLDRRGGDPRRDHRDKRAVPGGDGGHQRGHGEYVPLPGRHYLPAPYRSASRLGSPPRPPSRKGLSGGVSLLRCHELWRPLVHRETPGGRIARERKADHIRDNLNAIGYRESVRFLRCLLPKCAIIHLRSPARGKGDWLSLVLHPGLLIVDLELPGADLIEP